VKSIALKTFLVYKLVNGKWLFWMNARGKSAKHLKNSIVWQNKYFIPRENIRVIEK